MIFLPKFPTRVLFTSVPARVMLNVNFVVPGSFHPDFPSDRGT